VFKDLTGRVGRGFKPLVMITIVIGLAAPASAFQVAGSRLNKHAGSGDAQEAMEMWAECAANIEGNWAQQLLSALPTSEAESAIWDKHFGYNDRCLTSDRLIMDNKQLRFTSTSGRGEIARYLARREVRPNRQPAKGAAMAWLSDGIAALPKEAKYDRSVLIAHQFALCVADAYWPETRAFVLAKPDSSAEKAALAALSPKLGDCMPPGATLNLTKPLLRVLIDEAAYHAVSYKPRT
jgi:hypothetical protein